MEQNSTVIFRTAYGTEEFDKMERMAGGEFKAYFTEEWNKICEKLKKAIKK